MTTLRQAITDRRIRRGPFTSITKDGSYWAVDLILRYHHSGGPDSVPAGIRDYLSVRHYSSGKLRAYLIRSAWHKDLGQNYDKCRADDLLDCETIDDLCMLIRRHKIVINDGMSRPIALDIDDACYARLIKSLSELPISQVAPDDR